MPIQGKTTNIGASDINKLLGTPNQTVSLGNMANTWFGVAKTVSLGNDFTDTFNASQVQTFSPSNLTNDPIDWFHRGEWCSGDQVAASTDGQRVAISRDGTSLTILSWSGSAWVLEQTITNSSFTGGGTFSAVAMNSDGSTIAIGQWYYTTTGSIPLSGAISVWTRSGTTWSQQAFLTPTGWASGTFGQMGPNLGSFNAISISADGNTIAGGATQDNGTKNASTTGTSEGAVYIFTRSGTTWSQQARLTSAARYGSIVASYDQRMGTSVSLSSDGNTMVTGGPYDSATWGCLLVFTRSGTTWSQQYRLENNGTTYGAYFGGITSVSPDGNTLCVTWTDYSGSPTVYRIVVFTRSAGVWSQQQQFLETLNINNGPIKFIDNNTMTIAGVAVWTRSGSTWTRLQSLLNNGLSVAGYSGIIGSSSFFVTTTDVKYPGLIQYNFSGSSYSQAGNTIYIKPTNTAGVVGLGRYALNFDKDILYVTESSYRPNGAISKIESGVANEFTMPTTTKGEISISADGNWMVTADRDAYSPIRNAVGNISLHANVNGNWVWQSSFQPTDVGTTYGVWFGTSLVISADGSTVVAMAQYEGSTTGYGLIYMFSRTGSTLTQQGRFTGPTPNGYSDSPGTLAISSDGNTVSAGWKQYSSGVGNVKVYTRNAGVWSLQSDIPAVRKGTGTSTLWFGNSVTLSSDGNTMAIGAPLDTLAGATSPTTGAVHIYTRSGSTWTLKTSLQLSVGNSYLGYAVSLSGDGYTLLVSAPGYTGTTTAYAYKRASVNADVWTQYNLLPSGGVPNSYGMGNNGSLAKINKKGQIAALGFGQSANGVMVFK